MSKATTLNRFRIVKVTPELRQEFDLPEFICADPHGSPFIEGQLFYRWVVDDNCCEPTTAYNYLNAVLPFLTFLWDGAPSLRYTAPPEQIRHCVRDYLKERLGCVVHPHRNGNFIVKITKTITATSARLFLTALRRFYYCAKLKSWYPHSHPLEWTARLATPEPEFKPKMPPRSGLTLPEDKKRTSARDLFLCCLWGVAPSHH